MQAKRVSLALPILVVASLFSGAFHEPFKQDQPHYKLTLPDGFGLAEAMSRLYGNYDAAKSVSTASTPPDVPQPSSYFGSSSHIRVRSFFATTVDEKGEKRLFLLTYGTPAEEHLDFGCHACAPLVSAFEFSFYKGQWTLTASCKNPLVFGQWGFPPDASVLKIGPGSWAVKFEDHYSGQGETTIAIALFVPWNGAFDPALKRWMGDDDAGTCAPGLLPCYANHKDMKFVAGPDPNYFDVLLTLSGTEMTGEMPFRIRSVSGVERLRFENGKYKSLFRSGDTPAFEREALKSAFYQ